MATCRLAFAGTPGQDRTRYVWYPRNRSLPRPHEITGPELTSLGVGVHRASTLNISTKSALLTLLVMMTEEQDCAKPAWISVVRVEEDAAAAAEPLGVATAATELLLLLLPLANDV